MLSDRLGKMFVEIELLYKAANQDASIDLRENAAEELLMNNPTINALGMLAQYGPKKYREEAKARLDKIQEEMDWVKQMAEIEDEAGGFPGVTGGAGRRKNE